MMTQKEVLERLKKADKELSNLSAFANGWFVGDIVNIKFDLIALIERFEHFVNTGELS